MKHVPSEWPFPCGTGDEIRELFMEAGILCGPSVLLRPSVSHVEYFSV